MNAWSTPQRVVDDLKRKADDMGRISDLSLDLQNLLNVSTWVATASPAQRRQQPELLLSPLQDYEANVDRYNSTLEERGLPVAQRASQLTLADAIKREVKLL